MDAQRVRQQLDRILASTAFAEAGRAGRFLRHVVERKLEGRDGEIKESIIAIEVLGRNASFDSKSDPIVRVEAGRLRDRLGAYYEAEGGADPILISLPKGRYVPEFTERRLVQSSRRQACCGSRYCHRKTPRSNPLRSLRTAATSRSRRP